MKFINNISSKIIIIASIALLAGLFSCNQKSTRKQINLNEGWEFYYEETGKWYPATVPGNIHTDLFANDLIEDPFYGTNADSLEWISNRDWKYRKEFDISAEFINRNLDLVFDGIDTHAEVFLNGEKLGETQNMFRQWVFVINDSVRKKTNNLLEVTFHPSSKFNSQKQSEGAYAIPDNHENTRKAPYQYGWDWAPKLETCGIYKDVYINSWEKLRIKSVKIEQKLLTDTAAILIAHIELESENFYNGNVVIFSPHHKFDTLATKLDIYEGCQTYQVEFRIDDPELWWCNGLGNPTLYDINVQVSTKFRVEEQKLKTGLRKIELISDTDEHGQSFYFILNGIPVFARGANWVPAEYFNGSNSEANYKELLEMAKDANFNMLRVWGGGIYENDEFYNLCDSLGIMVWQDFMFACAMYPLDDNMRNNVSEEVKYQVKRLYNHPSVVMYCGNNEISNGWFDWGWQKQFNITAEDSAKIWNDYDELFHRIIPKAISSEDKSRKYIPSSPFFGWGNKESLTHGDSHYWGVWWGMEDFDMYFAKTGRFMSEYGFQSLPEINSLEKFIPKDSLYRYSASLKSHQKHPFGFKAIAEYMQRDYPLPQDFDDYVYMSQLLQAEGMQTAFDAHLSAMPYCMGSLFWQYNDCWPVVSWSAVDYYHQPKALYYFAKRSFDGISIAAIENDNKIKVFAINHRNTTINAKAVIKFCDYSGNVILTDSTVSILNIISSNEIIFEHPDIIANYPDSCYAEIILTDFNEGTILAKRTLLINRNVLTNLPEPEMHYNIKKQKDFVEIEIKSKVFIKSLQISANQKGRFSDNWIDIVPGETIIIRFYPSEKDKKLEFDFNSLNKVTRESE